MNNCKRLKHRECSTVSCLIRGGWKPGTKINKDLAFCPAYEIAKRLVKLGRLEKREPV